MFRRWLFCLAAAPALAQPLPERIAVRGIYSNPKPFWDKGARLEEIGINAVFAHAGSINADLMARAKAEGAKVYAEFPTLNGKGYVETHPEAWPVNEKGEKAAAATWFLGACPTEPGFRAYRLKQLSELLDRYDIAGVWMDYFHWHAQFEDPHPVLPETCFSPTCVAAFEKAARVKAPGRTAAEQAAWILAGHDGAWRSWRAGVLEEWARQVRSVIESRRPGALLGVYHCPWKDEEYGGARRRILGLDWDRLAPLVDVFSPMVYHGRMERPVEWVGEFVAWFCGRLRIGTRGRPEVWPIVQAHNSPGVIPAAGFERAMRLGAGARATGIMVFTASAVAADPAKLDALQRLYRRR